MSDNSDHSAATVNRSRVWGRLFAVHGVLVAALLVVAALAAVSEIPPLAALAGVGLILSVAVLSRAWSPRSPEVETGKGRSGGEAELLERFVAALPEPALLVDRRAVVIAANRRLENVIGPARIGEPLSFTLRTPEVLDAVRAVSDGAGERRVEFQTPVPIERWFEAHVAPVRLSDTRATEPPGITLVLLRDLTPQRRLEQMRADFVANASHELRTPLAALSGFIETLQGPAHNDPQARDRFLAIMGQQARRMSRLIDDLLSLSRIELNLHVRPDAVVDLAAIAREVVDALAPLAQERAVDLRVHIEGGPLCVRGARDELVRVVENLVENALKYGVSPQGVDLRCAAVSGDGAPAMVELSVRDHGPGIAREHLPRLTERFYRVDVAHSREQGGTGLGLAIVKHILNRHRGTLAIESEIGAGAEFRVRLPRAVQSNDGAAG